MRASVFVLAVLAVACHAQVFVGSGQQLGCSIGAVDVITGLPKTNGDDSCAWYNNKLGCPATCESPNLPENVAGLLVGTFACGAWTECMDYVHMALCGYACSASFANISATGAQPFMMCKRFAQRWYTACKDVGVGVIGMCTTFGDVYTIQTWIDFVFGATDLVRIVDGANVDGACFSVASRMTYAIFPMIGAVLLYLVT
jgi:hypothetical protein